MKTIRRKTLLITSCLLLLCSGAVALAGVSRHVSDRETSSGKQGITRTSVDSTQVHQIWVEQDGSLSDGSILNATGDMNGDLWPSVKESPVPPYHPWVVWSRFNGEGFDLAWSSWERTKWGPIRWVTPESSAADDLDADLAFNHRGRPFLVWWRDTPSGGQVMLSTYLLSRWTEPTQLNDAEVDARYPSILTYADGRIVVIYETTDGLVMQTLSFTEPDTITDDINPIGTFVSQDDAVQVALRSGIGK
jgi:hypothetical protein